VRAVGTPSERQRRLDWDAIGLVVFDVDGTLYDQTSLRLRIARDLLAHSLSARTLRVVSVLRVYRRIREQLGEAETEDFERILISRTATTVGCSQEVVHAVVTDWIESRPLRYLASCRYAGVRELFARLREKKKLIGVFSDYPAHAKLQALGLDADHVVCAAQEGIRVLKPHPRGLTSLMAAAGVEPEATVLIGDRPERDGLAARRAGARALIRSSRPLEGWQTFSRYDGDAFERLLRS
jgi:putative hydrolase of the HAD superfamily